MARDDKPKIDNTIKDPSEWTTGSDPITGAQMSQLSTLAGDAGIDLGDISKWTKGQAGEKITELREAAGLDTNPGRG